MVVGTVNVHSQYRSTLLEYRSRFELKQSRRTREESKWYRVITASDAPCTQRKSAKQKATRAVSIHHALALVTVVLSAVWGLESYSTFQTYFERVQGRPKFASFLFRSRRRYRGSRKGLSSLTVEFWSSESCQYTAITTTMGAEAKYAAMVEFLGTFHSLSGATPQSISELSDGVAIFEVLSEM